MGRAPPGFPYTWGGVPQWIMRAHCTASSKLLWCVPHDYWVPTTYQPMEACQRKVYTTHMGNTHCLNYPLWHGENVHWQHCRWYFFIRERDSSKIFTLTLPLIVSGDLVTGGLSSVFSSICHPMTVTLPTRSLSADLQHTYVCCDNAVYQFDEQYNHVAAPPSVYLLCHE